MARWLSPTARVLGPGETGVSSFGGRGRSIGRGGGVGMGRQAETQRQTVLRATATPTTGPSAPGPSKDIMGLFTKAMKRFQPGGTFGKREEALLGRAKKKYLASSAQSMVSAGLSGTTVPMAEGAKFQEEIGEPTRLGLEDVRTSRLNELLMAKAGYMGGVETQQFGAAERMKTLRASLLNQGGGGGGRSYSGGVDPTGRIENSPTDIGAILAAEKEKKAATWERINQPGFGASQIPEGGQIVGNTYFPPSRFTRNVPEITM